MKSFWPFTLALFASIFIFTGCHSNDAVLSGVRVTVSDFRPVNATMLETQAALTLRFINEGVEPIAIEGTKHRLFLNGTYVGQGVAKESIGIPSLNTTTRVVTVYLENLALLRKIPAIKDSNMIDYRLESELLVMLGEDRSKIKTVSSGQLDIKAFANLVQ